MPAKVPNIVASEKFVGQESNISQTIFTPAKAGLYRASMYSDGSTGTINLTFTDDAGSESILASGSASVKTFSLPFRSVAGQPVGLTASMDTFPFNLSIVIESLELD